MARYEVEFEVEFLMGKQRPRFDPRTKRAYTPSETKDAEYQVGVAYKGASIRRYGRVVRAPRGVPVHVKMDFYKKGPKSFPRNLPKWLKPIIPFVVKIDIDNGAKCVLDGLNGIAWYDDAQVVTLFARKQDRNGVTYDHADVMVVWESGE